MSFKSWLAYHAKTAFAVAGALILVLIAMAAIIAEQSGLAVVFILSALLLMLYSRYRNREHDIHTQQRKYGRR